jgi:sugar phosphate isomerase/epimerase
MKNFKIGLQLYSVRDAIASDLVGTLKAVKAAGYDYIESAGAGFYGLSADEAKKLLAEIGLTLISVHSVDVSDQNLAFCAALGVKNFTIPYYALDNYKKDFEGSIAYFNECAEKVEKYGMRLFYHNHDFEFETLGDKKIIDRLYTETKEGAIAPQFDVCWVTYGGSDPAEYIRKYAYKNLTMAHLKDFTCKGAVKGAVYELIEGGEVKKSREENLFKFKPVGQGVVNFDNVLAAAEEVGIDVLIVEQDQSYETPAIEAVSQSRAFLKSTYGI